MRLGIIGRGRWGDVYARELSAMQIPFWQAGRNWHEMPECDGIIIASEPYSHYTLAKQLIQRKVPVLIEKPVCLTFGEANKLLKLAKHHHGIVFCGHTRLYSPAWKEFKQSLPGTIERLEGVAGGAAKIDPWWDWGPHLMAMYVDLLDDGKKIKEAWIEAKPDYHPLRFDCDGMLFVDVETHPSPVQCLLTDFLCAIEEGQEFLHDMELAAKVTQLLQASERRRDVA